MIIINQMENGGIIPNAIKEIINDSINAANSILQAGLQNYVSEVPRISKLKFYSNRSMQFLRLRKQDCLTVVSFIFKFEDLPNIQKLEYSDEDYNLLVDDFKGYLNFVRPIILNQENNCYYEKVLMTLKKLLSYKDPEIGCGIICYDSSNTEINEVIISTVDCLRKAVKEIVKCSDLDFLYNGYLQHDDEKFTKRLIAEKENNIFSKTIISNALAISCVINSFSEIYHIFKYLEGFGLMKCKEIGNFYI